MVPSLKGSASIVGLPRLEAFAHEVESRLSSLRSGASGATADLPGALIACRDRVASILESGGLALREEDLAVLAALDGALSSGQEAAEAPPDEAPPKQAEAPPKQAEAPSSGAAFSRVANAKLDFMLEEASELTQAISELGRRIKATGHSSLAEEALSLHALASRHYRSVLSARTVPFGEAVERYRHAIAEIARESGKEIDCEVSGAETEIDKALLHLARNAADHGIESPAERVAAGKGRKGRVLLGARRDAGFLVVRVEDDGRGVDPSAIRAQAEKRGLQLKPRSEGDEGLLSLLLLPGFSLSSDVTKWSGRGVGLDAVERSVRMARGSMRLENKLGRGFAAEIRLPLALSLVEGFTAVAGETDLLVPFESVHSCVAIDDRGEGKAYRTITVGDRLLPAVDLGLLYGAKSGGNRVAIIVESGGARVALVVDKVGEALSAAVRPLDRRFADSPGVSGLAALGDGTMVLVLDAPELVRLALAGD